MQAGVNDVWIGNNLIDPTKGKRPVVQPEDPKGRRGLFETLQSASPGEMNG